MSVVRPVALIGTIGLVFVMSAVTISRGTDAVIAVTTRIRGGVAALSVVMGIFYLFCPAGES